jgi:hypothetical protein
MHHRPLRSSTALHTLLALVLAACGASHLSSGGGNGDGQGPSGTDAAVSPTAEGGEAGNAPGIDASTSQDAGAYDPFAAQPDQSGGLTNVSTDLNAILENGALANACAQYQAGHTDTKTTLLCGKWMYFYDPLGTSGIPAALMQFMATNFPDQLGLAFSKLGMVPDPTSTTNLPLGIAPTVPLNGNIDAVAFTCASCHFAKLPDGRYAVGAANHGYDYARHILAITLAPTIGSGLSQASSHDPAAVAMVQPVLDALSSDATLKSQMLSTLLPLASLKLPSMSTDEEHDYSEWPTGTMDFLIAPLPVDDHVHTVSKIEPLWGIPSPAEVAATGMSSALLATTGDAPDLDTFVWSFGVVGQAATPPTAAQRAPLVQYILSLRAPSNPTPPDPTLVSTGAALYVSKGCATCHDGPRGSGKRVYAISEVGTDPAMAQWADPDGGSYACCGVPTAPGGLTHGLKSPRMVGMWAQDRFLHNGALSSLEQLFCMDATAGDAGRPPAGSVPMQTVGHDFTCENLNQGEKEALLAYLRAH